MYRNYLSEIWRAKSFINRCGILCVSNCGGAESGNGRELKRLRPWISGKIYRSDSQDYRILEKIYDMRYHQAKKELMKLCGVGEKVAECICLFALHHMDAFPIDTHIRQVMDVHYKRGFPNRRYKGMRGIMQQYIFYYDLYS